MKETEKARLIKFDFDEKWIPKSACDVLNNETTLRIKDWFFKKNWHWLSKTTYVKEYN
jgi:hypothetical protein